MLVVFELIICNQFLNSVLPSFIELRDIRNLINFDLIISANMSEGSQDHNMIPSDGKLWILSCSMTYKNFVEW